MSNHDATWDPGHDELGHVHDDAWKGEMLATDDPAVEPVDHVENNEGGTEALGAGAGALGGAAVGMAVGGPPGAVVGGVVGAVGGAMAGEATEGDDEAGAGAGAVGGPPGAVIGGAVGAAGGAGAGDKAEEEKEDTSDYAATRRA